MLKPKGRPVPSVLSLSSTRAIAGLDMAAVQAAAINDAPMPMFGLLSSMEGFLSMEHLTFPFCGIVGNPRTDVDETLIDPLRRPAGVMVELGVLTVMAAIFLQLGRK